MKHGYNKYWVICFLSVKLTPFMCKWLLNFLMSGFLMNGFSIGCIVWEIFASYCWWIFIISTTEFQVKAENPPILYFFYTKYQCSVALWFFPLSNQIYFKRIWREALGQYYLWLYPLLQHRRVSETHWVWQAAVRPCQLCKYEQCCLQPAWG